jgi:hypothetical protein
MARALRVEVIGDVSGYTRSLDKAAAETKGFGAKISSGFATFAKGAGIAAAAAGAVAVEVGKTVVDAAISAQEQNDKLTQSFKNQKSALEATSPAVLALEKSSRALGFTNTDTRDALTRLVNTGMSWKKAQQEMTVAQNLSRVSGKSLGDSTSDLIRLQAGATRAAKQYGIVLAPVTAAQDKLKASKIDLTTQAGKELLAHAKIQDKLATGQAYYDALSGKVKGQAKVFSESAEGGIKRFHAGLQNLEEQLGSKLLPVVGQVADGIAKFMDILGGSGTPMEKFQKSMQLVGVSPEVSAKIVGEFVKIRDSIVSIWGSIGPFVTREARMVWTFVQTFIAGNLRVLTGVFEVFSGLLHGNWSKLWKGIQDIVGGVWMQIEARLKLGLQTLWAIFQAPLTRIGKFFADTWNGIVAATTSAFNRVVAAVTGAIGSAINAAAALGRGILHGVDQGLVGLVKMVQGWFQTLWAWIKGAANSAYAFALNVGKELIRGVIDGLKSVAGTIGDAVHKYVTGPIGSALHSIPGFSPPVDAGRWLGSELVRGIIEALNQGAASVGKATTKLTGTVGKGMGNAAAAIVAAAKKAGVDARAALAVAMSEGGTSFGAVGDKGTSFGPFQLHIGGASPYGDPAKAAAFANSIQGITYALNQMAAAGAKGKGGFDAIAAIVRNFERPADPSGEIQRTIGFYKQIPGTLGGGLAAGAKASAALVTSTLTGMVNLVKQYGPVIGAEHVKGIIAGLLGNQPSLVAQARAAILQAVAAQKQAVIDARAGVVSAFQSLGQQALAAFDAATSAGSPAGNKDRAQLAKMQAQDQAKAAQKAINDAMAGADTAYQAYIGATQQTGESDADFATRQAGLKKQWTDALVALGDAQRAQKEQNLGLEAAQDDEQWNKRRAALREGLAQQLVVLEQELKKHPQAWDKTSKEVMKILKKYDPELVKQGRTWADKFTGGLAAGLEQLQAALAAFLKASNVGGGGGGGGGAGGPPRPPDVGSSQMAGQPLIVHTHAYIDGKEVAHTVRSEIVRYGVNNAINPVGAY